MTSPLEPSTADRPAAEPTLGEVLTRAVRTAVPTRLYQLLHLALPLAVDFAFRGWWRPAAGALAVTAFGAWGLADRWLAEAEHATPARRRLVQAARVIAGVLAAAPPAVLVIEAFLRFLGKAPIS